MLRIQKLLVELKLKSVASIHTVCAMDTGLYLATFLSYKMHVVLAGRLPNREQSAHPTNPYFRPVHYTVLK